MRTKDLYNFSREPVPSEYATTEIISRALLLAAGGDDGHGKQLPAEGGFIYNFTDNRYPPVTEKDGGKIGIYCDPSFDCENINQPALEPEVLSRISNPDKWLPPFLQGVFTFIPVRIQRLEADDAAAIVRRYGVHGTENPAAGDFYIEIEITFSEAQRRTAQYTADREKLLSLIKSAFPGTAYTFKYEEKDGKPVYVFGFYDGLIKAADAPERIRNLLSPRGLLDVWEVSRDIESNTEGRINYTVFSICHK